MVITTFCCHFCRTGGETDQQADRQSDEWTYRHTDGQTFAWMDGNTDKWIGRWTDGRTDRQTRVWGVLKHKGEANFV